jgi:hypothetical protein
MNQFLNPFRYRSRRCESIGGRLRQRSTSTRRCPATDRRVGPQRGQTLRHLKTTQGLARLRIKNFVQVKSCQNYLSIKNMSNVKKLEIRN